MRKLLIIMVLLIMSCSSVTTIREPDGKEWEITSRNDAVVHASLSNGVDLTVDNRGKPSTLDELIKLYFMQWAAENNKETR